MRLKTAENQNRNRKFVTLRLRKLEVSFLLSLIEWNEQSGEYLGNRDRWELKRARVKQELEALAELDEAQSVDDNQ